MSITYRYWIMSGLLSVILIGCSSAPAQPDYRYEEQKRGADKAQKELQRSIRNY